MKKSLSYILLLTISIAALGACGNKETASSQNPENSPHNSTTTKFSKAKEVGIYQAIHNNKNPMIWYQVKKNVSKDAYPVIFIFKDNRISTIQHSGITLGDIANLNTTNSKKILEYINSKGKQENYIQEIVKEKITSRKGSIEDTQQRIDSIENPDTIDKQNISGMEKSIEFDRQDILALEKFDTKPFYDYYPITISVKTSDSGNNTIKEIIEYTEVGFSDHHDSKYTEEVKNNSREKYKEFDNFPLFIRGPKEELELTGQPTVPFQIYDAEFTGFYVGNGGLFVTLFDGKTKYTFDSPKTKGIQVD